VAPGESVSVEPAAVSVPVPWETVGGSVDGVVVGAGDGSSVPVVGVGVGAGAGSSAGPDVAVNDSSPEIG